MNPFIPPEVNTCPDDREGSQQEQPLLEAALTYAKDGFPVFPCAPGAKKPLTANGFYDATTNLSRIKKWWAKWPAANIGIPTGEQSGFIALDIDIYKPEAMTQEDVEAQLGPLPDTRTIGTGRGGVQLLYRQPESEPLKNIPEGMLGPGVCVKASGGYVIAPPSSTEGTYKILDNSPLSDPPTRLLEAAKQPVNHFSRATDHRSTTLPDLSAGEPIPEGQRDNTLTSIAGRLHNGRRTLEKLEEELLGINQSRCSPPLETAQVRKIARSIHHRPPCRTSQQRVTPEILEALDLVRTETASREWQGVSGHTDRDVMIAIERVARRRGGEMIPTGLRVEVSIREIAEEASIGSTRTVWKSLNRLKSGGCLRRDGTGKGPKSGAIVFPIQPRARGNTSYHVLLGTPQDGFSVSPSAPPTTPRLRWSAPGYAGRLGKIKGHAVDLLEAEPLLTIEEVTERLGHKRPRDVCRRILQPLIEAGIVVFAGGRYSLAANWRAALDTRREEDGEVEAAKRQKQRHEEARRAFQDAWKKGEVIGKAERRCRERWRARRDRLRQPEPEAADGEISELQPALTGAEREALNAIRSFEARYGCGSFDWSRAGCKMLFYRFGVWPEAGELERIRAYVDSVAPLEAA